VLSQEVLATAPLSGASVCCCHPPPAPPSLPPPPPAQWCFSGESQAGRGAAAAPSEEDGAGGRSRSLALLASLGTLALAAGKGRSCDGAAAPCYCQSSPEPGGRGPGQQMDAPRHLGPTETDFVIRAQRHLLRPTKENPIPTMVPPPTPCLSAAHFHRRYVISIIGLPVRGKAHTAKRLQRYMEFFHGAYIELFDISEYASDPESDETLLRKIKEFFEQGEEGGLEATSREQMGAEKSVHAGRIAILFASNTAQNRRSMWGGLNKRARHTMKERLGQELQARLICVEIVLDDNHPRQKEHLQKLCQLRGIAEDDVRETIEDFKIDMTTIQEDGSEDDLMYMKLMNFNSRIVANNMMRSFIGARVCELLASVHPYPRTVYLTRHGESMYNQEKKLGGDSSLSKNGVEYAKRLAEFAHYEVTRQARGFSIVDVPADGAAALLQKRLVHIDRPQDGMEGIYVKEAWDTVKEGMQLVRIQCGMGEGKCFQDVPESLDEALALIGTGPAALVFVGPMPENDLRPSRLWTSSLKRTKETAEFIAHPKIDMGHGKTWEQFSHRIYRNLDEVYVGEYEGLTYEDIKRRMPEEAELRKLDKLGYRYPRGESYYDIIARLDDPIQHLGTLLEPVLIISHQATLRLVYAFLSDIPRREAPQLSIPLHTVIKMEFDGMSSYPKEERFYLGPTCVKDDGQKLI